MSAARSRKIELKPVPPDKLKEYIEKYRRTKGKTEIETINHFESPEAKEGFRQAEEVLKDGTLFDEFTEERLREQQEKEEQRLREQKEREQQEQQEKEQQTIRREKYEEQTRIDKINAAAARKQREERERERERLRVLLVNQYQREKKEYTDREASVSSRQNASNHTKYGNDVLSGIRTDSSRTDWGWLKAIGTKKY
jgi:hypothetical protein